MHHCRQHHPNILLSSMSTTSCDHAATNCSPWKLSLDEWHAINMFLNSHTGTYTCRRTCCAAMLCCAMQSYATLHRGLFRSVQIRSLSCCVGNKATLHSATEPNRTLQCTARLSTMYATLCGAQPPAHQPLPTNTQPLTAITTTTSVAWPLMTIHFSHGWRLQMHQCCCLLLRLAAAALAAVARAYSIADNTEKLHVTPDIPLATGG